MRFEQNSFRPLPTSAMFDLLRSRIEFEVVRPAVVAITSSTSEDGKEVAARGLASSLAATGYRTLFIDTSLSNRSMSKPLPLGHAIDEMLRQAVVPAEYLAAISLSDPNLQRSTSRRELQAELEILRSRFDYVLVSTECGGTTSFATSIINSADAVLVSVKRSRKETREDRRLSAALGSIGSRFLGLIAFEPSALAESDGVVTPINVEHAPHRGITVETDRPFREVPSGRLV